MSLPTFELPALLRFANGTAVADATAWVYRRRELLDSVLEIEYGRLPPPVEVTGELLHQSVVERWGQARFQQYRLWLGGTGGIPLRLDLSRPPGDGPFPAVVNGDACWRHMTDEIRQDVLARGCMLAEFSRVEVASDDPSTARLTGVYRLHPGAEFGALAAWAWAYHRVVDFLLSLPQTDAARIAVAGHSRGGKTVLLAGATDPRIALTAPNNSGCGGAGCFRGRTPQAEQLGDILRYFPYWFSPRLQDYVGREDFLPFDQHALKALVAPRALLTTEALGDLWANPSGTWRTHLAAREVFRFLGAADNLGICYRDGGHAHGRPDWAAMLDFLDYRLRGQAPARLFDQGPQGQKE